MKYLKECFYYFSVVLCLINTTHALLLLFEQDYVGAFLFASAGFCGLVAGRIVSGRKWER